MVRLVLLLPVIFLAGCVNNYKANEVYNNNIFTNESKTFRDVYVEKPRMPENITFRGTAYAWNAIVFVIAKASGHQKDGPTSLKKMLVDNNVDLPSIIKTEFCKTLSQIKRRCVEKNSKYTYKITIDVKKWGMIKGWGSTLKPFIVANVKMIAANDGQLVSQATAMVDGFSKTPAMKLKKWKKHASTRLRPAYVIGASILTENIINTL